MVSKLVFKYLALCIMLLLSTSAYAAGSWGVSPIFPGGSSTFTYGNADAAIIQPALNATTCRSISVEVVSSSILASGMIYRVNADSNDPLGDSDTLAFTNVHALMTTFNTGPGAAWFPWSQDFVDVTIANATGGGTITVSCHADASYPGDLEPTRAVLGTNVFGTIGIIRCASGMAYFWGDAASTSSMYITLVPINSDPAISTFGRTLPNIKEATSYPVRLPGTQALITMSLSATVTPGNFTFTCI